MIRHIYVFHVTIAYRDMSVIVNQLLLKGIFPWWPVLKRSATDDWAFYRSTTSLRTCRRLAGNFQRQQTDVRQAWFWCHIFPMTNSATFSRKAWTICQFIFGVKSLIVCMPLTLLYHTGCPSHAKFRAHQSSINNFPSMLAKLISIHTAHTLCQRDSVLHTFTVHCIFPLRKGSIFVDALGTHFFQGENALLLMMHWTLLPATFLVGEGAGVIFLFEWFFSLRAAVR